MYNIPLFFPLEIIDVTDGSLMCVGSILVGKWMLSREDAVVRLCFWDTSKIALVFNSSSEPQTSKNMYSNPNDLFFL